VPRNKGTQRKRMRPAPRPRGMEVTVFAACSSKPVVGLRFTLAILWSRGSQKSGLPSWPRHPPPTSPGGSTQLINGYVIGIGWVV
jgi:hypothetical protein